MRNQKGFTLVEMLLSLTIFFVIVSFIPPVLSLANQKYAPDDLATEMEWEIFIQQLTKEYRRAHHVSVNERILSLRIDGEPLVTYEPFNDKVRRRVDQSGHEVVLQFVKLIEYKYESNLLHIKVVYKHGEIHETTIKTFMDVE
ncbi:prepilin-type N-terminal cleavage/methylation domain-containing protein [Priestia flexa]|jgi:competence protein ComGF|uniref:Prepilin-type N-terminal cleavage/methylation domain-containing protein n=1 Tax=Priestia flexa TaxID=86664 RepID=A0A8I1MCN3_9BACI|nr:competence type IV pilus minor pilin ComGF [Priestia flexa]MBN8250391.1 prepilin-type N-terminal cleavage/methylation domain-containing protein [Priestia flexa]MBN8432787.1 prepilin-type N-terminal cleavage/methylation domain-containing protein [Priestia flexa]MCA0965227.1 prepilin-type N-terminal cleavage/methylation domain-containing protein [Priestia flexa]RIV09920.1 prepilin-type N-terminal cleavage/methylation domain-containing protein [Priestia flexa]UIR29294.1 prepilin-type N-termina